MPRATSKIYAARRRCCGQAVVAHCLPAADARRQATARRVGFERTIVMLDVIYLLVGAAFLGVCVLYAYACDHL
jgi:hypothetical protein